MSFAKGIGLFFTLLSVWSGAIARDDQPQAGGQADGVEQEQVASEVPGLGKLPASFEGDLPSADGPRIRYHLDLFPERVFVLRLIERGREDAPLDQIGSWAVSGDGGRLMLTSKGMTPRLYAIGDADTLHTLDPLAQAIEPPSSYDLTRVEPFAPVEPRLILHGLYGHAGDARIFRECRTGWRLPVAPEGDGEAMESAYSRVSRESGEPLFVTLAGRIVQRPNADGEGMQMTLVVDRFIDVWPSQGCRP